jgi:quinol-cytochrome oxidoreductase complex cytochrome b subunit
MVHALAILCAVVWLGLNGLLWYAKPSDLVWLAGSAILGVTFFAGFFWYLAPVDRLADNADR